MSETLPDQDAADQRIVRDFYNWIRDFWISISRSPQGESLDMLNFGYWLMPDDDLHRAQNNMREHVLAMLPSLPRGACGLEVGCGIGGMTAYMVEQGFSITCLDLVTEQLLRARKLTRCRGLEPSVRFVRGNSMAIPFADEAFDFLYCLESAFHYPDKHAFLHDAMRVVRPGATLVIADITCADNSRVTFGRGNFFASSGAWIHLIRLSGFELLRHERIGQQVYEPLRRYLARVTRIPEYRTQVGRFWTRVLTNYAELARDGLMDYELFALRKPSWRPHHAEISRHESVDEPNHSPVACFVTSGV
jgi:cyclopropane fatty-acyl-phospholipid synthase-like methyltransferase